MENQAPWPLGHPCQLRDATLRREACNHPLIKAVLDAHGLTFKSLPRGAILGTVNVVEMHEITPQFVAPLSDAERAAGDYTIDAGRWAWELADVVALATPIEIRGWQGLWNAPDIPA